MQIKIRPDDARMIQNNDGHQMNDWLAELRDGGAAGPPGDGQSEPDGDGDPRPEARAGAAAAARAGAEVGARAGAMARGMVLDAARARRGYGGRWHPPMPVGMARAW